MEDSHIALTDLSNPVPGSVVNGELSESEAALIAAADSLSLFGVFDGHGGELLCYQSVCVFNCKFSNNHVCGTYLDL